MPEKLGHYEIVSELGRGGMGVVYKAYEPTLDRHVAIKLLSNQMADDPVVVARFQREARSVAALNHPNIIQVFFIGSTDEGQHYFVMEYVAGQSLGAFIREASPIPVSKALELLIQVARGLAAAHDIGVIHRDIKPANIMIDGMGRVKIADFGIALTPDLQKKLTATGQFLGTPGYLSPEVCLGEKADARTDIFSLGVVFFEMLTGKVPFHADSPLAMLSKVVNEAVPDVREFNAEVAPEIHAILTKMVEKSRQDRYQDCHILIKTLQGQLADSAAVQAGDQVAITAPTEVLVRPQVLVPPIQPTNSPPLPPAAEVTGVVAPPLPQVRQASPPAAKKRGWLLPVLLLLFIPLLAGGGYFWWRQQASTSVIQVPLNPVVTGSTSPDTTDASEPASGDLDVTDPTTNEALLESQGSRTKPIMQFDSTALVDPPTSESTQASLAAARPDHPDTSLGGKPSQSAASGGSLADGAGQSPIKPKVGSDSGGGGFVTSIQAPKPESETFSSTMTSDQVSAQPVPAKKQETQVVIITSGDTWIADPVSQHLNNSLKGHNFELMESELLEDIDPWVTEKKVNLAGLSKAIAAQGGDILVVAELIYLGERQLRYLGRESTAYRSRLKVRAISLADRKMIGNGWQTEFEYTQLNASTKAEEACRKIEIDLVASIRQAAKSR